MVELSVGQLGPAVRRERSRAGSRFYIAMSVALAVTVFAGFARSFYLRPLFERAALPSRILMVHGVLFTSWIVLVVVQSALAGAGRIRLHRALGIAGVGLAGAMVIFGVLVQWGHTRRALLDGTYASRPFIENLLAFTSLLSMLVFAAFVGTALRLRRRPEQHRRLMLLATITLSGAAISRMPAVQALSPAVVTALPHLFLLPLVLDDLLAHRKILPVTLWGCGIAVAWPLLAVAVAGTSYGTALVRWFGV